VRGRLGTGLVDHPLGVNGPGILLAGTVVIDLEEERLAGAVELDGVDLCELVAIWLTQYRAGEVARDVFGIQLRHPLEPRPLGPRA